MTLTWRTLDERYVSQVSTCGRYSVSEYAGAWQAWKLAPGAPWFAQLGRRAPSKAEAEALCQSDAEATRS